MRKRVPFGSRRAALAAGGAVAVDAALQSWPAFAQPNESTKARIGVIGSGHIGGTIGGLWAKAGHPVLFSSRHPEELKDLVTGLGPLAQAGTVAQAIAFGDALLIAVPYGAVPQIGQDYASVLKGKILLDACNAVPARDGPVADEVERNGIGITSEKYLPGTRLVRAFNTLSYAIFAREANRLIQSSRFRLPVTMLKHCRWPRCLCGMPVSTRSWSASSRTRVSSNAAIPATAKR